MRTICGRLDTWTSMCPSEIDIYPIDFESKESVVNILDNYNSRMEAEGKDEQ